MDIKTRYEHAVGMAIELAESLVSLDETERALNVLDNCLPAILRQHKPEAVLKLRAEIMDKLFKLEDYANNDKDHPSKQPFAAKDVMDMTARGGVVRKLVTDYNKIEKNPHIVDMGPGTYWLPLALEAYGLRHSYKPVGVEDTSFKEYKELSKNDLVYKEGDPQVFVAFEIIEHVEEQLLAQIKARHCPQADYILVSTPRFTFGEGTPNWRAEKIHHLRAYTPQEFMQACARIFPEVKTWQYVDDAVMVLVGET